MMHNLQRYRDALPPWLVALLIFTGVVTSLGNVRDQQRQIQRPTAAAQAPLQAVGLPEQKGVLSFELPNLGAGLRRVIGDGIIGGDRKPRAVPVKLPPDLEALFEGESQSLVAKAIGAAEGTRMPTGEKTPAYYGHVDPGNGAWNQGTFSYQHEAYSPEEADYKQMQRLRRQGFELHQWAERLGVPWGLEEQLNALDLANQAPLAALSQDGYLDRLKEAYDLGYAGSEAVLQARVYAYLDPETNQWNAPGLGNTLESIRADQQRRQQAVAAAIAASGAP
ncbi:MAG: hypothetical protein ACFB4J_11200 [Elainellaceae cyanobacterium]